MFEVTGRMLPDAHLYQRYAVYYAPPDGSRLARLGAAWLGLDPVTGEAVSPSDLPVEPLESLPQPREALVRAARVYGFHGTLKAPFRLADGIDPQTLDRAVAALAARQTPISAPRLSVQSSLGFVALMPSRPDKALNALAAACVTELDPLRAPLRPAELEKRRRGGLDMVEEANLRDWGYPYVLDRFRFHMTLTGQLPRGEAARVGALLHEIFDPALETPFAVDAICVFGDPGEGQPFRLLKRYPLGAVGEAEPVSSPTR